MTARNEYLTEDGDVFMQETAEWTARLEEDAWRLAVASRFKPVGRKSVVFGDQEEMGLGVRLPSSIAEKTSEGTVRDSENRADAQNVWGRSAAWCDYSAGRDGRRFGITIYPSPENFRPCWWHVRDTGLMVANPFGRRAMTAGEPSRIEVAAARPLVLRFTLRIYDAPAGAATEPSRHVEPASHEQE